jgi:hypothetical protein
MNKEFVKYEQALSLKELGFDEPCLTYYHEDKKFEEDIVYVKGSIFWNLPYIKEIAAPLYQQAFRWFREKHKLQHSIWSGKINTVFYGYNILNIDEQEFIINNSENGGGECDYAIYEEAEKACLDKLIEITKTKNNEQAN